MKLNQIQSLEYLLRKIDDELRIVFKYDSRYMTATFLKKDNTDFVISDIENDHRYFRSEDPLTTAETMWHRFRNEYSDGWHVIELPTTVDARTFKRLIKIATAENEINRAVEVEPFDVRLLDQNLQFEFFLFSDDAEFIPLSAIQVAKQD